MISMQGNEYQNFRQKPVWRKSKETQILKFQKGVRKRVQGFKNQAKWLKIHKL
jgi:hypothetical protein